MAQFNTGNNSFQTHNKTLFEVNMLASANGHTYDSFNRVPIELTAGASDAFGRLRVSEAFTLGDYKHLYSLDPNFIDKLTSGGTVTYQHDKACARLTTTSSTTSAAIHQTKFYHHYMPGKSQLIKSTFNFYANTVNVTKRSGYYDDKNGIYIEQDGNGIISICLRTNVSGTPDDTRKIPQSEWNIDKCDGTGASGFNIDISKTQILFIDFQWLGVGRVRVGFVHNGQYIVAHEFYNSNYLDTVYMSNPNLPVRCEIFNTGTTAGAYMDQICSTVISEGGYVEAGQDWETASPTLVQLAPTNGVVGSANSIPVLSIRLANSFHGYENRMIVRSGNISIYTKDETVKWQLVKLPNVANLTGGVWANVHVNSGVQYNANATAYTDGEPIDGGYVAASTTGSQGAGNLSRNSGAGVPNSPSSAKKNYIVQNFDSTNSEIFSIILSNLGTGNTSVGVSWQWREIY